MLIVVTALKSHLSCDHCQLSCLWHIWPQGLLVMLMLTIRPGTTSCLAASQLNFTILFCKLLDQYLEALPSRRLQMPWHIWAQKCHLGAMRGLLGAAKLAHKIGQLQPSWLTTQNRNIERETIQALWCDKCCCHDWYMQPSWHAVFGWCSRADMQGLLGAAKLACKICYVQPSWHAW